MTPTPPDAIKHDQAKTRMDLALGPGFEQVAQALTYGARKYDDYNYRKGEGLHYSRLLAAALRHLTAWNAREDLDPESHLNHLAHAGASIFMLLDLVSLHRGKDDRWCSEAPKTECWMCRKRPALPQRVVCGPCKGATDGD